MRRQGRVSLPQRTSHGGGPPTRSPGAGASDVPVVAGEADAGRVPRQACPHAVGERRRPGSHASRPRPRRRPDRIRTGGASGGAGASDRRRSRWKRASLGRGGAPRPWDGRSVIHWEGRVWRVDSPRPRVAGDRRAPWCSAPARSPGRPEGRRVDPGRPALGGEPGRGSPGGGAREDAGPGRVWVGAQPGSCLSGRGHPGMRLSSAPAEGDDTTRQSRPEGAGPACASPVTPRVSGAPWLVLPPFPPEPRSQADLGQITPSGRVI